MLLKTRLCQAVILACSALLFVQSTTALARARGLDAVLLNLLSNAVYWLSHKGKAERKIEVRIRKIGAGVVDFD